MKPYCRNNSNFTFREICCSPPIYDDCCCNNKCDCNKCKDYKHDCNCGNNNQHNCDCGHNHKPPCNPKEKEIKLACKPPYICLPLKKLHPNRCNPFLYVMIGYMIGCDNDFRPNDLDNEDYD